MNVFMVEKDQFDNRVGIVDSLYLLVLAGSNPAAVVPEEHHVGE